MRGRRGASRVARTKASSAAPGAAPKPRPPRPAGFVRLYRPGIGDLLTRRDKRLARRADREAALQDRRLEVLSHLPIDWATDLNALEADAVWRGLKGVR